MKVSSKIIKSDYNLQAGKLISIIKLNHNLIDSRNKIVVFCSIKY